MLSAIAARKAAKAEAHKNIRPEVVDTDPNPTPSTSTSRTPNKRKTSSHLVRNSTDKKRRKSTKSKSDPVPSQNQWVEAQVIHLESSDEDLSSESYISDVSIMEEVIEPPTSRSRRWSPSAPVVVDSSDDEDSRPVRSSEVTPVQTLSTYTPSTGRNYLSLLPEEVTSLGLPSGNAIALGLAVEETICFVGVYFLRVLRGQVDACGASLPCSSKPYRVFAPKSSHLPVLRCVRASESHPQSHAIPPRLQSLCQESDAVVVVQELRTNIEGLGLICRTFSGIFKGPPVRPNDVNAIELNGVSLVTQPSKSLQPYTLPPSWSSALDVVRQTTSSHATSSDIFLVKGPKKTGKSTFSTTLVNTLLSRYYKVAFLECDVGQSEFSPVGLVALHVIDTPILGPSFSHPTLPYRAHFVGSTSPRSSPNYYLTVIQNLMDTYRQDIQTPGLDAPNPSDGRVSEYIPLVVNTMGWTKGLGASLLEGLEGIVQPTRTFEFDAPVQAFDHWREPAAPQMNSPTLHRLSPITSTLAYTAADLRTLSILSYFHSCFPAIRSESHISPDLTQVTASSWDTRLPLCARPPYVVDCSVAFDKVLLVGAGSEDVVPSEINRVLNGAVVALLHCEEGTLDEDMTRPTLGYTQNTPFPSQASSHCLGLALIRSISPDSSTMQLLTPIPPSMLGQCRVVVKGEIELPIWGMLDFRESDADKGEKVVPYLQWGRGEGIGSEKRRVRRNLMRRGQ